MTNAENEVLESHNWWCLLSATHENRLYRNALIIKLRNKCILWSQRALLGFIFPAFVLCILLNFEIYYLLACCYVLVPLGSLEVMWVLSHTRSQLSKHQNNRVEIPAGVGDHVILEEGSQGSEIGCYRDNCDFIMVASTGPKDRSTILKRWVSSGLLLSITSGVFIGVALVETHQLVDSKNHPHSIHTIYTFCLISFVSSVYCGCLVPDMADGMVMLVYQACFLSYSLNTFLIQQGLAVKHYIDSLFLLLMEFVLMAAIRVIQSNDIMESVMAILFDSIGLLGIVAPMILLSDCLSNPALHFLRHDLIHFFLCFWFSELGRVSSKILIPILCKQRRSKLHWDSFERPAFLLALIGGLLGLSFSFMVFRKSRFPLIEATTGVIALVISQVFRAFCTACQRFACFNDSYSLSSYRIVGCLIPFLIAFVIIYPYLTFCILKIN
ncbi:unnamed protein product [Albugo candida]|uniref:Uncharacterized protein n=1 Tax=Albugo candida TaxID=65357 RepID=A0A024FZN2_9STRA|nr:unnamed protein product [Albugo candida]|eukprot:CCI39951.1 unnamed protein product [Albugo candida]